MPPIDIVDLDWEDGSDNTAGIGQYVYFAKKIDILTLPKPVLDDSTGDGNFEDLVTITDNIVMKPGKAFRKIYVTLEKGALSHDIQGETDGKSNMNRLKFFMPGSEAKVLGFLQWAKNSSLIFLIPEIDGQVRMLGHENYPAKLDTAPGGTGEKSADLKGTEFNFMSARKGPAPIFQGKVNVSSVGSGEDADSDGEQDIIFID